MQDDKYRLRMLELSIEKERGLRKAIKGSDYQEPHLQDYGKRKIPYDYADKPYQDTLRMLSEVVEIQDSINKTNSQMSDHKEEGIRGNAISNEPETLKEN